METHIKENIEKLFIVQQKIKSLEAVADEIKSQLPDDMALTGEKISFPATREHQGFTVWQQVSKTTSFDQSKLKQAYRWAVEGGLEAPFEVTMKAPELAKVVKGTSIVEHEFRIKAKILEAVVVKDNKPSWRFTANAIEDHGE